MRKVKLFLLMLVALLGTVTASAKTVYIQPNDWTANNAKISLWIWAGDGEGAWFDTTTFTTVEDGILKAVFADDDIDHMIVVQGENAWGGAQTANLTIEDGKLYKLYDYDGNKSGIDVDHGIVLESYTEPLLRNYYVEGDASLISAGWNATDANKMTLGEDNKLTFTAENVMLVAGTSYGFKVYSNYGSGSWYPAGDNATVTVVATGYYNVTFTFDLENAPTAVATLVSQIGYLCDFDTAISTSNHDFAVAGHWKHIVDALTDRWGESFWMSYSYAASEGVNGTGALLAYRQYAYDQSSSSTNKVTYDLLVTPVVSGQITLQVKASISATSSNPAFIELYSLNENGTERVELLQSFDEFSTTDWTTITYNVESEQRIGIRAQYVYMDNFIAAVENTPDEKRLTINSVADVDGASTTYFNQQADGTILARYKVTITNSGDADLTVGEENYTLSLFNRYYPETTYGAFEVPVNLAVGETSEPFIMEVSLPAEQKGWKYWDVKENISGTTFQGKWCGTTEYVSKFIFDKAGTSYYSSSSATTTPIDFGKVSESTTVNYEIYNAGTAPLTINSFTIDAPFTSDAPEGEFVVAGGEKKQIAITFPAAEPGIFSGNITIAYTNADASTKSYTLPVNATVLDASKNFITFSNADNTNGQFPAGSIHSDQVYVTSKTEDGVTNYYLQSTSTTTKFITPLLTAEAGEAITFDAWYSSYSSSAAVTVYTSIDRINWTQLAKATGLGSSVKTFTATIAEAGDYYLAFELVGNALLDNIYGLTLAATPAHDWYFTEEATIPTTGKQNADYTANIKVQNISSVADAVETATLYVGGEAVVTLNNVTLAANDKTAAEGTGRNGYSNIVNPTEITFTYKPHTFGTFNAYIELKSGDKVVTTNEVEVVIAEEKVDAELSMEGATTQTTVPLAMNWNNSESVSLYPATLLAESFGLKAGDKISSITWKGTRTADEYTTTLSVWYEWTDDVTLTQPEAGTYNTEGMTQALSETHTWAKVETLGEMFSVNFTEPLVYEEGKSLRIVVRSEATTYKQAYFEAVSKGNLCFYHRNDNATTFTTEGWSSTTYLPAIHLGLVVEPTTLAGTVTDGTNPVEGATVTIRNAANDVEYAATTDAEGKYTINVIQDKLAYKAVADVDGLVSDIKVIDSFAEAVDFVLSEPQYGDVWTGEADNADLSAGYFKYLAQEDDKLVITYTENPTVDNVVKFTKPNDWSAVYAYAWDSSDAAIGAAWHGTELTSYYMNEFDQQVYSFEVPANAAGIIFNDGGSNQTVDISDFNVTGYYTDGSLNEGKYNVLSWTDNNTAIQLCDATGKVVADATLADGTAEFVLTENVIAQLAKGLFVNVKGTEATISKVELKKGDYIILAEDADGVEAGTYAKVKIERTFKAGWNAVVLPFEITAAEVAATFGADAEVAAYTGDEGTDDVTVKFAKKTDDIAAGTPILLWLANDVADVQFQNKEVVADITTVSDNANTFEFTGVYTETTNNAGDYIVQGGEFRQADASNSVLPFRAYLKLKEDTTPARSLNFVVVEDGGSTTGIDAAEISGLETVEGIYNLNGQKVETLKRGGLYIINGKKVVLRK